MGKRGREWLKLQAVMPVTDGEGERWAGACRLLR